MLGNNRQLHLTAPSHQATGKPTPDAIWLLECDSTTLLSGSYSATLLACFVTAPHYCMYVASLWMSVFCIGTQSVVAWSSDLDWYILQKTPVWSQAVLVII